MLAPLPFPDSDRLIALDHAAPDLASPLAWGCRSPCIVSTATLPAIDGIALYATRVKHADRRRIGNPNQFSASDAHRSAPLAGMRVALGRWFVEHDGVTASPNAAVISHGMWQSRFAASPSLLFGVAPNDLVTHAVTGTVLLAVALTACWWPARCAASLAPSDCLRAR